MHKEQILQRLNELQEEIKECYKAEIKGIFGSYAKGEETPHSDIDVLVDFKKGADLLDFTGLSIFLEEKLQHKVDIVPLVSLREEIRENVLADAIYL